LPRPCDHPVGTRSTTVVLVDPTSPDGHTSLNELCEHDTDVLVVVLLSGRASNALRAYAHHEDMSIAEAGWIYLDQVAVGLDRPGRTVGTIAADGPDPARTLADIATQNGADRVALPSSILRSDRDAPARLAGLAPVAIALPRFQSVPVG
jgi:hypothetical protein